VAETRAIVETGVRGRDDLTVLDATDSAERVVGSAVDLGSAPYVQLWPHRHGTDAMFVALVEKRR
jgi:16S rRNA (cytosine967-C5)-methyltransferase